MKAAQDKKRSDKKAALSPSKNNVDFMSLVKEVGYVKARQMIKQVSVAAHQTVIQKSDADALASRRPARVHDLTKLSMTTGSPAVENALDKMIASASRPMVRKEGMTEEEAIAHFDASFCLNRSYMNQELMIAQMDLDHLPDGIADTLSLQLGHLRRLNCGRNKFTGLLSHKLPQFSPFHIRHVEEINLSCNQLTTLCPDVSMMTALRVLNLSENNLPALPDALSALQNLVTLNLASNSIITLGEGFGQLQLLETLNLSSNKISHIPGVFTKMRSLKYLNLSKNSFSHLAILPLHMKSDALWHKTQDEVSAKIWYVNVLTKERVSNPAIYSGDGITKAKELHVYQRSGTLEYRRRKIWLSVCQVYEWEPIFDDESGSLYYRNNVSGESQWEVPAELDILGAMESLEVLDVSENQLKALPPSLCDVKHLKKFICFNNRLHNLPDRLGDLKEIELINVKSNELDAIPPSICDCESLKEFNCQDNHLKRLPDLLGTLKHLEKLYVQANALKSVPFSLGFTKTLIELHAHDNPLVDPPFTEFAKGLEPLQWYLRQRYFIEARGMPPPMKFVSVGLNEEIHQLHPEFKMRVKEILEKSKDTGDVNLQLMGLKEVPAEVVKCTHIKDLRLDQNGNLRFKNGVPQEFKSLRLLTMRSCNITDLPESISVLIKLHTLDLQENAMKFLPPTITRLRKLASLNVSKNSLYALPSGIGNLNALEILNIESNNLCDFPPDITQLKALRVFNGARNRFSIFARELCTLTSLRRLNLEGNQLCNICSGIKHLSLEVLRIGYNRIEWLHDDMFEEELGKSIMKFSVAENNLLDLPLSLINISPDAILDAEFNPLKSPPPPVLAEGLKTVQAYMRIRHARLYELDRLLSNEDFSFVIENATPAAIEVLDDGTGFLTPDDLLEFDEAVDEYMNGELYKCAASGEEIIGQLVSLRDARESELYLTVLTAMEKAIHTCLQDPNYSEAVIKTVQRAWGRRGEPCNCYAISLHALLRDTPSNKYQKAGRPAMFHLIESYMPHTIFPFTVELLKDSLRLYISPYGQVADTEVVTFEACDCIDDRRHKPLLHSPCQKPAVVLVKIIYSDEEAQRRDAEEDMFDNRFEDIEQEIRMWLQTKEGKKLLAAQTKRRQIGIVEELNLREELQKNELYKERQFAASLEKVKKRVKQFEQGLPYESHLILRAEECQPLIDEAEAKLQKQIARNKAIAEGVEKVEKLKKLDKYQVSKMCADDLVQKYCALFYNERLKDLRKFAIRNKLRRPWDGEDGAEFEAVRTRLMATAALGVDTGAALLDESAPPPKKHAEEDELKPEYDWEDTDHMEKFEFKLWDDYKRTHWGIMGMAHKMFS